MHRSGTSAVSGVLESLGFSIGKNVMPSTSSNPKGYFENQRIVNFNDHLLKLSGVNWADVFLLPFGFFQGEHPLKDQEKIIKKLILEEFNFNSPILIKDPRMCVLLPLWQPVFKELHLNPSYILVNRHPAGVIRSLKTRDNLSEFRSEKLWLYYNFCAELYSREERRIHISYDHLLTNLPEAVKHLRAYMPFLSNPGPGEDSIIKQFIDPSLNHHSLSHASENFHFPETGKVYRIIEQACNVDNFQELAIKMDDIRNRLDLGNTFRSLIHEENQARITLKSSDGSSFSQLFIIDHNTKQIDLEFEQSNHIKHIVFNPVSCPCLINISQIQLFDQENQLINTENLETNAIYVAGNLFLFNCPFPIIHFTINPALHPVRLTISLQYLIFGERTPYYFLENHFKNLIKNENDRKLILNEPHKELFHLKKQLEDMTQQVNKLKQSFTFRLTRIIMKPGDLIKRLLLPKR